MILSKKCVFCDKRECKRNGIRQRLIQTISEEKKNEILQLLTTDAQRENHLLQNRTESTIFYHTVCFNSAINITPKKDEISKQKLYSSQIFTEIKDRVQQTVFVEYNVRSLAEVYEEYSTLFEEGLTGCQISDNVMVTPQQLLKKLLLSSSNLSKTVSGNRTFIHPKGMPNEDIQHKIHFTGSFMKQIKTVAFEIRKKVFAMEHHSMPRHNLTVTDIINRESDCPPELHLLIECLVKGVKQKNNQRKDIRISKICDDLIFAMSNGSVKPSNSIILGMATKSITGSRKMVEILNRLGHCCSYSTIEELETELAYGSASENRLLPSGLKNQQSLCTHVAFDNFDRYVETSSGKDTLHDTVGIVYQNKCPNLETSIATSNFTDNIDSDSIVDSVDNSEIGSRSRRKYYSNFNDSIEPFIPLHSNTSRLIGNNPKVPNNWKTALDLDNIWMYYFKFGLSKIKRWSGWNADRVCDENPIQVIGYLPNLNMSPTNDAVVMKTLEMAKQLADECNQKYIVVTYDLAIAMKAYHIKDCMSPQFDRIFVNLGGFHIEMSYFKVCMS